MSCSHSEVLTDECLPKLLDYAHGKASKWRVLYDAGKFLAVKPSFGNHLSWLCCSGSSKIPELSSTIAPMDATEALHSLEEAFRWVPHSSRLLA